MSPNWIAATVLPLIFFMVIVMECSRLHCARIVQRRIATSSQNEAEDES